MDGIGLRCVARLYAVAFRFRFRFRFSRYLASSTLAYSLTHRAVLCYNVLYARETKQERFFVVKVTHSCGIVGCSIACRFLENAPSSSIIIIQI